jgi:hypothetical protein
MVRGVKMILFQTVRKKWDFTCTACCNIGIFGHIALPFEISWWFTTDVENNKCREISFSFLCFTCYFEYWKWNKKRIN